MRTSVLLSTLAALLTISLICPSSELIGQEKETRARRGRFLQRLREDLFGNRKDEDDEEEKEKSERKSRESASKRESSRSRNVPSGNPNLDYDYYNSPSRSSSRQPTIPGKSQTRVSSKSNRDGFGMIVVEKDEVLIIARVDSRGNASDAGLKKGDRILEFGGLQATSMEEFEEVAKVMSQGDQMEMKIRRGSTSPQTVMLQWGETPEVPKLEAGSANALTLNGPDESALNQSYSFVPPSRTESSRGQGTRGAAVTNPIFSQVGSKRYELDPRQIQRLIETVSEQRQTIDRLEQEVQDLRQTVDRQGRGR